MEIDKKLNFSSHISNVCKNINNQLHVMLRFRTLIPRGTLLKLYKAYILPHFYYCSSVWHFCGARDADKLEALNKRFILGDYSSPYSSLFKKVNTTSLANKRVQNFLILLFKSLFSPIFQLTWKICSHLGSSVTIYVAITFCPFVSLEQRALALTLFHISQLNNGMRYQAALDCMYLSTVNFSEHEKKKIKKIA